MQFKEIVDYLFTPTSWLLFAPNYAASLVTGLKGVSTVSTYIFHFHSSAIIKTDTARLNIGEYIGQTVFILFILGFFLY